MYALSQNVYKSTYLWGFFGALVSYSVILTLPRQFIGQLMHISLLMCAMTYSTVFSVFFFATAFEFKYKKSIKYPLYFYVCYSVIINFKMVRRAATISLFWGGNTKILWYQFHKHEYLLVFLVMCDYWLDKTKHLKTGLDSLSYLPVFVQSYSHWQTDSGINLIIQLTVRKQIR